MFHFSSRQFVLLAFGFALILTSVFLGRVASLWEDVFGEEAIVWQQLTISTGNEAYVSALDEKMLVLRSASHAHARLTVFTREGDNSAAADLVKDLCDRDSCVYRALDHGRLDGAIADYSSGTPMRIVLMHLPDTQIWLEYKGPPEQFDTFGPFIEDTLSQLDQQVARTGR